MRRLGGQVLGGDRHRSPQRVCFAHERQPAVVWDVQPLVGVGGPRVGARDAGHLRGARRRGRGPQAECAVHVQPRLRTARVGDDRIERIGGACVHVAGLGADDRGRRDRRQCVRAHPALGVGGNGEHAHAAEPEEPERLDERGMGFRPHDHGDRRRAEQPLRLDVPSRARQHRVARSRQPGEVGDRGACDERASGLLRQAEQLDHPGERHLLERRRPWRDVPERCVLIPRARQPVRGHRDRQRPADHESEEPATRDRDRRGRADIVEHAQHLRRIGGPGGQRLVEAREAFDRIGGGRHGARVEAFEIADAALGGIAEQRGHAGARGVTGARAAAAHDARGAAAPLRRVAYFARSFATLGAITARQ